MKKYIYLLLLIACGIAGVDSDILTIKLANNIKQEEPQLTPEEIENLEQQRERRESELEEELEEHEEHPNRPTLEEGPGPGETLDLDENVPESPQEEIEIETDI